MTADTFAHLVALETLIDAEVGYWLRYHPASMDRFRETLVSRISDLVDEIDALDAVAAARVYDAVVDFLAGLPDDDDGVVESTLRFKRAVDRLIERAMEPADLEAPPTWAVVLDELLDELAVEYGRALADAGEPEPRAYLRSRYLLAAARQAAERVMPARRPDRRAMLRDDLDRLWFAVERRLPAAQVEPLIRDPQRVARRHRPSNLTRVGGFVVGQLLRRGAGGRTPRIGENG